MTKPDKDLQRQRFTKTKIHKDEDLQIRFHKFGFANLCRKFAQSAVQGPAGIPVSSIGWMGDDFNFGRLREIGAANGNWREC